MTRRLDDPFLSSEEITLLIEAGKGDGTLNASVLMDGKFSEENFYRFGMLERLTLRGYLDQVGKSRNDRSTSYHYEMSTVGRAVAAGPLSAKRELASR